MPMINIERIISVTSEDPAYPAENILKPDNNKKWKCKPGEKQASVILQIDKETTIDRIDIGNENSAFVEVLVGKSSAQSSEFKVLLVASSLMTLKEAKDGTNANGVRFFKKEDLTKPTADEKWDRVKIVCTQPFNKHVQYGLSFVVLHTDVGQNDGTSSSTLGRFALKEEESNDQPVKVGNWFAKRNEPSPPIPPGAAAAIRDASSPAVLAQGKNKKPTSKRAKDHTVDKGTDVAKPTRENKFKQSIKPDSAKLKKTPANSSISLEDEDSPADDTDADSTYSPNKDSTSVMSDDDLIPEDSDEEQSKRPKKKPRRNKLDYGDNNTKKGKFVNGATLSDKQKASNNNTLNTAKHKQTKPFEQLLDNVVIVISGYQNPLRGELRSKACAMGAKYKADWESNCTHLICAFVNTPKFNQVRGRGKIVKKEWIEQCYDQRKRLPWRRFCLDRNDVGTSSEDEVWEEQSVPTTSAVTTIASGVNRRHVSSGSDTEEEIERVRARQTENKRKKVGVGTGDRKPSSENTLDKANPFGDDTDIDSDAESQTATLPFPPLPEVFDRIVFHIAKDIDDEERRRLQRYIIAYKGCLEDHLDGSVEYVITRDPSIASEVTEEFGITVVSPDWIWECSDAGKLVPVADFIK